MSTHDRLTPYRSDDVAALLEMVAVGKSVAVIGLSNFGKSTLLRQMVMPQVADAYQQVAARAGLFVYIDCNRMLEMSGRASTRSSCAPSSKRWPTSRQKRRSVRPDRGVLPYGRAIQRSFAIPLAFNDAMITLLDEHENRDVILLLDEFDAVVTGLDERVFLNMRALKDKYTGGSTT